MAYRTRTYYYQKIIKKVYRDERIKHYLVYFFFSFLTLLFGLGQYIASKICFRIKGSPQSGRVEITMNLYGPTKKIPVS